MLLFCDFDAVQTPEGDLIDCIPSHLQPAFDHPKLKGQKPLVDLRPPIRFWFLCRRGFFFVVWGTDRGFPRSRIRRKGPGASRRRARLWRCPSSRGPSPASLAPREPFPLGGRRKRISSGPAQLKGSRRSPWRLFGATLRAAGMR